MDMNATSRRKRHIDDGEYQASKRYISENFFNMRISQPQRSGGLRGNFPPPAEGEVAATISCGDQGTDFDDNVMADIQLSSSSPSDFARVPPRYDTNVEDIADDPDDDLDDLDGTPAPRLSRGTTAGMGSSLGGEVPGILHPFLQQTASTVADERVDDWIRTSRQRLHADASVDGPSDLCRALILYKPVALAEGAEEGAVAQGGGDPTHPPQCGGSDGDEAAAVAGVAGALSPPTPEQSAGSNPAEAADQKGEAGKGENRRSGHLAVGDRVHSAGAQLKQSTGLSTASSSRYDTEGAAMSDSDEVGDMLADEMELTASAAQAGDGNGGREMWRSDDAVVEEVPGLARMGTSRGMPTPELTPEWAAHARMGSLQQGFQRSGEHPSGLSFTSPSAEGRVRW